jgi:replicative DNA helicase
LIEYLIQRSLIRIGRDTEQSAYNTPDALDLLDRTSSQIRELYGYTQPTHTTSAADDIASVIDGEKTAHLSWGIPELDRLCVFQAGLPHVFAGRPGMGKSIFCLEILWHLAATVPVLLFSPEMTKEQIQHRLLAHETGVPYSRIKRKELLSDQERIRVARMAVDTLFIDRLSRIKLDTTGGITPDQIRVRAERSMQSDGIKAFAVDHLHKMKTGHKATDRSDFERVSQCMNGITEIAKNTMLPALVMAQLNREVEKRQDKRPSMADLRGSGEIEQDAAVVGLLYRAGYYSPEPPYEDNLSIAIGKNRDGSVGDVNVKIIPAISRIGTHAFPTINEYQEKDEYRPF